MLTVKRNPTSMKFKNRQNLFKTVEVRPAATSWRPVGIDGEGAVGAFGVLAVFSTWIWTFELYGFDGALYCTWAPPELRRIEILIVQKASLVLTESCKLPSPTYVPG